MCNVCADVWERDGHVCVCVCAHTWMTKVARWNLSGGIPSEVASAGSHWCIWSSSPSESNKWLMALAGTGTTGDFSSPVLWLGPVHGGVSTNNRNFLASHLNSLPTRPVWFQCDNRSWNIDVWALSYNPFAFYKGGMPMLPEARIPEGHKAKTTGRSSIIHSHKDKHMLPFSSLFSFTWAPSALHTSFWHI